MTIIYTIGNFARTTESGGVRFLYASAKGITVGSVIPLKVGGTAYKVPAGKKFVVTEVHATGIGGIVAEFSSSTSTSAAGTPFVSIPLGDGLPAIPIYAEISAGKYIVAKNTHVSYNMEISCYLYGIEVNA